MTSTYRCSSADKTLATEALRHGEKKKTFPCVAIGSSPEKKGTTKDTKSTKKSFFFSFVLFVSFVVQGFYAFCDNLYTGNKREGL